MTQKERIQHENTFSDAFSAKPRFSELAVAAFRELKITGRFHPFPRTTPSSGLHQSWRVGSRGRPNQSFQI